MGAPTATVSFSGTRHLVRYTDSTSEKINLNSFALQFINFSSEIIHKIALTPKERLLGLAIVKQMESFYKESEAQLKICNIFTRFLAWLQGCFPWHRLDEAAQNFRTFKKADYETHFGKIDSHSGTVLATESQIELLIK